jgi:hypothetical protein
MEWVNFEEVLATYNTGDVAIIRSILDAEGLTYYLKGEVFALQIRPAVEPARLMVRSDQAERARELLRRLDLTFTALRRRRSD